MSITVVSAPSTPTLPAATGSDVSAAGQDFANLLLGQLAAAQPIAAEPTDLPIADAAVDDATLAATAPTDAAALLAALGLATTPTDAEPSAATPAAIDQAPAEATPSDVAPLDAAASMLAALGLAATPTTAPAPNLSKAEPQAGEPLVAVAGSAAQKPQALGETLTLNAATAQSATPASDDQAAKFAATLATAEDAIGAKTDSAATSDNVAPVTSNVAPVTSNLAPVTSNVAPPPAAPVVHRDASLAVNTPVRDQNWATDLGQKVVWLANADKQSAQLTLNPPEMGPIEISLDVDKGTASVSFTSANAEVRDALETALPKLREMFASAGIELGQTNVGAQSFSQQQAQHGAPNQSSSRGTGDNAILAAETLATLPTGALAAQRGNGMVDLFA